jgi:predicted acylesterase/phospholipase RssA
MLAGGGLKIAFQAGALQVWLDEAGVEFDHGDAVSAACFNLAMWAQGMSGTRIADNWRNLDPVTGVAADWTQLGRLLYARSLFELDAYRHRVFPFWGIDFERIRASQRAATFNLYNFSKHELCPVPADTLTEDQLIAAASLPLWFPPVRIGEDLYIDAVLHLATNFDEAIRRGADELWVIWTTSQKGDWFDGFVGNVFGIFEATTNHAYKTALRRIEASNRALERGEKAEFDRPIRVRRLEAEVPMHYLLNFSRDRATEAVNRGVQAAREFCAREGIALARRSAPAPAPESVESIRFRERGRGLLALAATPAQNSRVALRLETAVSDVDRFVTTPEHQAQLSGEIRARELGGRFPLEKGSVRWFVDEGDPSRKRVVYQAEIESAAHGRVTLLSHKLLDAHVAPFREQAGALHVSLVRGSVEGSAVALAGGVHHAEPLAQGVVRMGFPNVVEQLASFRVGGESAIRRAGATRRFLAFYLGRLWDVYARRLLPSAPF